MIGSRLHRAMAEIRIGTSGWTYPTWRGAYYPEKLAQARWLEHYARQFDTAEINNSFYRLPTEATVARWRDATPPGFVFAWKASRFITHMKRDAFQANTNPGGVASRHRATVASVGKR